MTKLSIVGAALLDLAVGLAVLGLTVLTFPVQPYWPAGFEYLLLAVPALLFPLATALRARGGRLPRWATFLLVNASLALGTALLAAMVGAPVSSLFPVAAVVLAGSAITAFGSALGGSASRGRRWGWARGAVSFVLPVLLTVALVPRTMSSWLIRPASQAPAPDVVLHLVDGTELRLASLRGRVVVLNFWGVYCTPCVRELPELESVALAYRGHLDVIFVAIEVAQGKDPEEVRAFAAQHGVTMPVAYDAEHRAQDGLGALGTPTTLILGPDGVVRHRRVGYAASANYAGWLTTAIEELLPRQRS
jgi:cytochrome c biogenesis protein CcmG/thiol:disulfide interchange protein DsbE